MALTYERLGLYNMVVLSTIVGAGIDASVHLFHAYKEQGPAALKQVVLRTGLAVAAASITTAVGFAGMAFSYHGGLASIGRLAFIGITACLLAALTVLPSCFALQRWWTARKNGNQKNTAAKKEAKTEEP
jgi:predicted RND superfamily exporter protein